VKLDGLSSLHKFRYGLLRIENGRGLVVGTAFHNNYRGLEYISTKFSSSINKIQLEATDIMTCTGGCGYSFQYS